MITLKKKARFAGLMYLIFIIFSIAADHFASFAQTSDLEIVEKVISGSGLFTFGLVCNFCSALFFLLAAWALYVLLKNIHRELALLFLLLNLAGVVIQCVSVTGLFYGMHVLTDSAFAGVFSPEQIQALALLHITSYQNGFLSAQLFFGVWLLPLGYLVYKSGFLPRILGILLMIDFIAIGGWFFQFFLFPEVKVVSIVFVIISALAEFGLTFWLLIKGVLSRFRDAVSI